MTQEELAKTMGKSQSAVANKIRLLSLPDDIQDSVLKERISERHARALLTVPDAAVQKELMENVIASKMSVRALEEEILKRYPKDKAETPVNLDINAGSGGYLNDTPLVPTAGIVEEESSNYGKVVIAPPKEDAEDEEKEEENNEEEAPMGKFINYGEIGKDEDTSVGFNGETIPESSTNVDVNDIRSNAVDIKPPTSSGSGAALDNMLNISNPAPVKMSIEERKQKEDYFSLPDLQSIKLDDSSMVPSESKPVEPAISLSNNQVLPSIIQNEELTIEDAVKKIKETIEELESHGVQVSADEMNFPKSYQIIIKIEKE